MHSISISTSRKHPSLSSFLEKIYIQLEQFRVKNHLRIVEQELLQKDVSHLSKKLQNERSRNISRLHEYWISGVYPKNIDFTNKRVPYFRDHIGTLCAMAYLIDASGHQEIVEEVARADNHVYIKDIKDGPVLEWIKNSGLTQKEAARVQPAYGPCGLSGCSLVDVALPWIFAAGTLIALEVGSYKMSSWLSQGAKEKRVVAWLYFTAVNVVVSFIVALWIFRTFV